ncbi:sugar phosphate nucleotidyltransferase [Methanobrevibacter sp.]
MHYNNIDEEKFNELINKDNLTKKEEKILEPYRVKRAIIIAAGLGTRLRPLTYNTPKPLVKINGQRIIDTIIDSLYEVGIEDIYVIIGYKAKEFNVLLNKYPNLHFIHNLLFDNGNNILSVCTAGNLISNAYIIPGDLLINNIEVFKKYQYSSNALGYKIDKTDDWCIETDSNNRVIRLSPGGINCYKDTGILYWNKDDGLRLSQQVLETCQTSEGQQRYWSNVPFVIYKENYNVSLRTCEENDVVEIDTIPELIKLDPSYEEYL